MKRLYTNKRNLCPVCGNHHGCAIRDDHLIECLRSTTQHDAPNGYRFIKLLKNGMGGLFALASDQPAEPRKADEKLQYQLAATQRAKGALPIPQRHKAIRRLHGWFGLGINHRRDLRARGLTDAQIDAGKFFSVYPNQDLPFGIPANLPGVTRRGDKLYTKGTGYVCPSFDSNGLATGWQIRYDNPTAAGGKYKWSASPHLPSGELPITVCRPLDGIQRPGVWLAEGFLKPYIAANRRGIVCIGSPNGAFAASPEQTLAALEASTTLSLDNTVIIAPDAGDIQNRQVMQRWAKQIEWLQHQGYVVNIEWWGQIDKSHPDIDELTGDEAISLISPDEFYAIARQHGGIRDNSPSYTAARQQLEEDPTIDRDQWELKFGVGKWLREQIKRTVDGFKGFGNPPIPKPKQAPNDVFQNTNQRLQAWQDAVNLGYKYILDASAPGLGKSHVAGIALPEAFDVEKLWYLSNDHRNPTTGVIESNYVDLPVRHNGLKIDQTRKTPNGNPFLVWPKAGEQPDTRGNCLKTDLFQKFRAKNLNVEASESSPICQNCHLAHLCKKGSGQKYGATFRGQRQDAIAHPKIRAHADSMPSPGNFDYSMSGLIWDEVGIQLKPMNSVNVTLADFDQVWAQLEELAPHLHEQLKPLRLALRPLLTGSVKQPYHGWDDAGIRALLPEKPANLNEIISSVEQVLEPDLSFLEERPDSISADETLGLSKAQQQFVNRQFRRQIHAQFNDAFEQLPLNWLVPFLNVWNGERGAVRCTWQQLTIFTKSNRHTSVAQAARFNIFLDATISREHLALLLGIDPDEIYVVGQEAPNNDNIKVIHIAGMGKLGKDRRDSCQERVDLLKAELKKRFPGVVIGDWQKFTQPGDGQWFVNLRGSNEFQHAPALAVFGNPCPNVGHLQALYMTLKGEYAPLDKENPHEGLQRFINAHIEAELEQSMGRLRSHLRPDEQLTFIFVGDYDLSFLGMPVETIAAFELSEAVATPQQKSRWAIWNAYKQLRQQVKHGTEIGLNQLARQTGITKGRLSQIAKEFKGWEKLQQCLDLLFNGLYNNPKHPIEVDEDTYWLAQTFLPLIVELPPLEALKEVATLIQTQNIDGFKRILAAASLKTKSHLLSLFLMAMPAESLAEIEQVFSLNPVDWNCTGGSFCPSS